MKKCKGGNHHEGLTANTYCLYIKFYTCKLQEVIILNDWSINKENMQSGINVPDVGWSKELYYMYNDNILLCEDIQDAVVTNVCNKIELPLIGFRMSSTLIWMVLPVQTWLWVYSLIQDMFFWSACNCCVSKGDTKWVSTHHIRAWSTCEKYTETPGKYWKVTWQWQRHRVAREAHKAEF